MVEWLAWAALVALGLRQNAKAFSATGTGLPNEPTWRDWVPLARLRFAAATLPPGTTWSSALRAPGVNAEVGGVEDSAHLPGDWRAALDALPPPGRSTAWLARAARESGRWSVVLDEGDHVHLEL